MAATDAVDAVDTTYHLQRPGEDLGTVWGTVFRIVWGCFGDCFGGCLGDQPVWIGEKAPLDENEEEQTMMARSVVLTRVALFACALDVKTICNFGDLPNLA